MLLDYFDENIKELLFIVILKLTGNLFSRSLLPLSPCTSHLVFAQRNAVAWIVDGEFGAHDICLT